MKDIEINSDKYTTLGVVLVLSLAMVTFFSDLYALVRDRIVVPELQFSDYVVAVLVVYIAVTFCRDRRLRKNYPYGVAGICLIALVFLAKVASHWVKAAPEHVHWFLTGTTIVSIASSSLILAEGVCWFRTRVTLS